VPRNASNGTQVHPPTHATPNPSPTYARTSPCSPRGRTDNDNDRAAKDVIATGSMEPAGDPPVGNEPVIGWRVWVVANNRLHSIAKNAFWQPGENQAECRVGRHKLDVPAPSCGCGFWALHNPVSAMQLAAGCLWSTRMESGFTALDPQWSVAVGLILGYGAIAVHGWEGYRASLASVACIFADAPEELVTEKTELRRTVADKYGVPCIALDAAISIGFLREMGVGSQAVEQLKAWIAADRPLADDDPIRLKRQIDRLKAQVLTQTEIARALNLRTVEIKADTGPDELLRWIAEHGR
jgi:hypothetical protein